MDFDYIAPNRIRVLLSHRDFFRAGINLESSDEQDIKRLKKYLLYLLSQIKAQTTFSIKPSQRLLIEVYPNDAGGAEVFFTAESSGFSPNCPSIFLFESSDDMINAVTKLFSLHCHRVFKSSLYQSGILWAFILCPLDGENSPALALLSEYGTALSGGKLTEAAIKEHFRPIIRERAADMIAFYFS